jgi:HSP20 family protein
MKLFAQTEPPAAAERTGQPIFVAPAVNIIESGDGYALEAEMPGVSKDGLEITLEGNEITLVGRRYKTPAKGVPLIQERSPADFRRVFEFDPAIDTGRITARMEQGVLTLSLPKTERVKPRRIAVGE